MNVGRPTGADAAAITELIASFDAHFLGKPEATQQDLLDEWSELDLERDAWLVEVDGRLAGYASLLTQPHPFADGYVHPESWGRGVGARLVELTEAEARSRGFDRLQNHVLGADERAHELLASRGYEAKRRYYRMEIAFDDPPPEPAWPDGFRASPYDPADAHAFHAALDEAFAEEWGHEPEHEIDWRARRERRGADRTLWFAVKDEAEIAAAVVCDADRFGLGWVAAIGVRKPWRRRGLGEALLLHSFGELYRRGRREIGLGVDAQNRTGATRLYERVGMHAAFSAAFFEKELGE